MCYITITTQTDHVSDLKPLWMRSLFSPECTKLYSWFIFTDPDMHKSSAWKVIEQFVCVCVFFFALFAFPKKISVKQEDVFFSPQKNILFLLNAKTELYLFQCLEAVLLVIVTAA